MDLSKIQFQPKKGFLVKIDVFFSNHLNLSTKSRIPLNRGALNPGLSVYIYIYINQGCICDKSFKNKVL